MLTIAYNLRFRMFGEKHEQTALSNLILQMEEDKIAIIIQYLIDNKKIYVNLKDGYII